MRRFLLLTALTLLPLSVLAQDAEKPQTGLPVEDLTIAGHGHSHVFHIEVATTSQSQETGLMFRHTMPIDNGMLFVFPRADAQEFWMKNTLIPLDMVFIDDKGIIHHIHANAQPNDLTPVPSNGPVLAVLELNGGAAAKFGLTEGDTVTDKSYFKSAR